MSYSKRDSGCANSAIVVTVNPKDYGDNPLDGIKFQRELEEKTYKLRIDYSAPDKCSIKAEGSMGGSTPWVPD